jgi:hypothetical protein
MSGESPRRAVPEDRLPPKKEPPVPVSMGSPGTMPRSGSGTGSAFRIWQVPVFAGFSRLFAEPRNRNSVLSLAQQGGRRHPQPAPVGSQVPLAPPGRPGRPPALPLDRVRRRERDVTFRNVT